MSSSSSASVSTGKSFPLLHLIEHARKGGLERQRFFHFIGTYEWILPVLQEARKLVFPEELGNGRYVRPPVRWPTLQVCENGCNARLVKNLDCILDIFVKISVEDALIHEVQSRSDVKQDPTEVMKLQRS